MTRWYLDASVALHAVLPGGDPRAAVWLDETNAAGDQVFSSTLLHLELTRVLRRERLKPGLAQPLVERIFQVSIDDGVMRAAAAIEPHVKSLDAIHLATCLQLPAGVHLASHDDQQRLAAEALGIDASDPISASGR